jgi:hypothetical protein
VFINYYSVTRIRTGITQYLIFCSPTFSSIIKYCFNILADSVKASTVYIVVNLYFFLVAIVGNIYQMTKLTKHFCVMEIPTRIAIIYTHHIRGIFRDHVSRRSATRELFRTLCQYCATPRAEPHCLHVMVYTSGQCFIAPCHARPRIFRVNSRTFLFD